MGCEKYFDSCESGLSNIINIMKEEYNIIKGKNMSCLCNGIKIYVDNDVYATVGNYIIKPYNIISRDEFVDSLFKLLDTTYMDMNVNIENDVIKISIGNCSQEYFSVIDKINS